MLLVRAFLNSSLIISAAVWLIACSGGGGSTPAAPTTPTTPTTTVESGIGLGTGSGTPTGTGTAVISGRVSGETSKLPLQGAVVKVYYASDSDPANTSVVTGADGRYSLTVNENVDLSLQFSAAGFATVNSERGQIVGDVSGADLPMSTTAEAQQFIDEAFAGPDYRSFGWVLVNTEAADGSELLGVTIFASGTPAVGSPSRNPVYVDCDLLPTPFGTTVTSGGSGPLGSITDPCLDDRPFMYAVAYGSPSTQEVTLSTSFDSDTATVRTGEFTIVDLQQPAATSTPGTTTAELTGTWKSPCFLDDEDPLNITYRIITATITASSIDLLVDVYDAADTICTTIVSQDMSTHFYTLGSDVTVNGTVAGITTATRIDITNTAPPNEVDYTIVAVQDNKLYLGNDDDPATDGSSDAKRPTQLDAVDVLTRQ